VVPSIGELDSKLRQFEQQSGCYEECEKATGYVLGEKKKKIHS